jgi:hypothetical protein
MIQITGEEAAAVRSKYEDVCVVVASRTKNSRGKTYYVEEAPRVMFYLERLRKKQVKERYPA